jgi:hypothetical protein
MSDFDRALEACLEAIREGRSTVEQCLRAYPRHAEALRPHLLAAVKLRDTYASAQPSEEFATRARERFLVASGKRLGDAYDHEPSPSFFAAARVRFLAAAHRMRREGTLAEPRPRRWPSLVPNRQALAGMAAALVLFFSFSTYTVASASSALPGDWRYPIKLETERVRLALAFSEGDKRNVRLDIAAERAKEIEKLTKNGDRIDQAELDRLANQTQALARDAGDGGWDSKDLAKLQDVSEKSNVVLQQAAPQVAPDAEPALAKAVDVSQDALRVATAEIVKTRPAIVKPTLPLSTPTAADTTPSAEASETPSAEASPTPEGSAVTSPTVEPTAAAPTATPGPRQLTVGETPVGQDLGVLWKQLVVGNLTALIPSEKDGWHIAGADLAVPLPPLVHLSNQDGTSLLVLNPRNGDMYWYQAVGGNFQEIQMRMTQPDGSVLVADPAVLRPIFGALADIPLYVLDSLQVTPPATPTPPPEPAITP